MSEDKGDLWQHLLNAVWSRQFETAEKFLKAYPEPKSLGSPAMKETVLHYLAVEDDLEGVVWLHERGFDINTCNSYGTPVVFEVAQLGYKDLLLWFIEKGVDLKVKDPQDGNIHEYLEAFEKHEMIEFLRKNAPNIK